MVFLFWPHMVIIHQKMVNYWFEVVMIYYDYKGGIVSVFGLVAP